MAVLLRHAERPALPVGEAGGELPLTPAGARTAAALGGLLRGQVALLATSAVRRCQETAAALAAGAEAEVPIVIDSMLGGPGAFVADEGRAWESWQRLGHEGMMTWLCAGAGALPGLRQPEEAARALAAHLLRGVAAAGGLAVSVTHDSVLAPLVARLSGWPLGPAGWPAYLEAALLWEERDGAVLWYRGQIARVIQARTTGGTKAVTETKNER